MQLHPKTGRPVSLHVSLFLRNFSENFSVTLLYLIGQNKVICLSIKLITDEENGITIPGLDSP